MHTAHIRLFVIEKSMLEIQNFRRGHKMQMNEWMKKKPDVEKRWNYWHACEFNTPSKRQHIEIIVLFSFFAVVHLNGTNQFKMSEFGDFSLNDIRHFYDTSFFIFPTEKFRNFRVCSRFFLLYLFLSLSNH